jgi:carboxymethylenebutenolidase
MAHVIDFKIGPVQTSALIALPTHPAKAGVVVSFNHNGFDPSTHAILDDLAKAGYAAIAPNHYHVMPEGMDLEHRRDYLRDEQFAADFQASFDWLVKEQKINPKKIALMGHCQGGRAAWVGASANADLWAGACIWYGGGSFRQSGTLPSPYDSLEKIKCPIIGFFGNDDKNPSPEDADKFELRLKEHGKTYTFHRYDGAGHAFMNFNHPRYHATASEDSWGKAMQFLQKQFSL